jgi:O-antigen/teichoic acid export membrane protein
MALGFAVLLVALRPRFRRALRHTRDFVRQARAYGFQVYVGSLLSIGTYSMDVLMLGALTNARTVGFYALAGAIANASGLPVLGLSLAIFRRLVHEGRLDRRWILIAWLAGGLAVLLAALLAKPVIGLVFSHRYERAARYVVVLAAAQAVRGVTSLYNSFLSARAHGKELRNAAVVLTVSNLVFNFALIPPFGAMGAAVASLLALLVNLLAQVAFYRRVVAAPLPAT